MPLCFPPGQSIPGYLGVMSLCSTLSEDKLHGEIKQWLLHVGMGFRHHTAVTVTVHLFTEIISTASHQRQHTLSI